MTTEKKVEKIIVVRESSQIAALNSQELASGRWKVKSIVPLCQGDTNTSSIYFKFVVVLEGTITAEAEGE